jgi:hypothetical protein
MRVCTALTASIQQIFVISAILKYLELQSKCCLLLIDFMCISEAACKFKNLHTYGIKHPKLFLIDDRELMAFIKFPQN